MAARDVFIGKTLGSCRIEELIGTGAFARVYRGRHVGLDQTVAVKVLTKVGPGTAELRFVREAKAAARLTHPNVARVHHLGVDGAYPFIIQEYLEGSALRDLVTQSGPLPLAQALRVGRHIARGLIAIHDAELVHRDIKPGNVMLLSDGSAKIVDFGLVGFLDAPTDSTLTRDGTVLGTPAFLAPEQASMKREAVGPAADVFALGGVLHFILTGYAPHEGEHGVSLMELLSRRLSGPADDVRLLDPTIPLSVSELLRQLLAHAPADRPSARDALELIRVCSQQAGKIDSDEVPAIAAEPARSSRRARVPSSARQRTAPKRVSSRQQPSPKSPAPLLIGAAVLGVIGVGAVLLGGRRAPAPAERGAEAPQVATATPRSAPSPTPAATGERDAPSDPVAPIEPIEPSDEVVEPRPDPVEPIPPGTPAAADPKPVVTATPRQLAPVAVTPRPKPTPTPAARAAGGDAGTPTPPTPKAKVLPPPPVDAKQVDQAVKRAAAWLLTKQDAKGAFAGFHAKKGGVALTMIAVRALLKAGVPRGHPAIERGMVYALGRPLQKTKGVAFAILALEARYGPSDTSNPRGLSKKVRRRFQKGAPVRDRRWLNRAVPWLVGHQRDDGRWGYPDKQGDLHNTMLAILALKAAARLGAKVDPRAWLRVTQYLLKQQEVDGPEVAGFAIPAADGAIRKSRRGAPTTQAFRARGWGYHPAGQKESNPTQGSIANALSILAICKSELEGTRPFRDLSERVDRALRDGAAKLAQHGVERRSSHPVSTLVSVEQAGTLLGLGAFGEHDWYAIGVNWLRSVQDGKTGAWLDVGLSKKKWHWAHPVGATSLAILFLRRATLPVIERPLR